MARELTPFQQFHSDVYRAMVQSGAKECPIVKTRTTGRRRFAPSHEGFRVCVSWDWPASLPKEQWPTTRQQRIYVTCHRAPKRVLERYAEILRKAGYTVTIDHPLYPKTRWGVWIDRAFDEYENEINPTKKEPAAP